VSACPRLRHSWSSWSDHTVCPGLGTKIGRLIWPCSADDDAAPRRLGWCCCWGATLRPNDRATGSYACRAWFGGSRVATGCGKPVRRCGGGKSPATEGALSEDPHSGQVVRAEAIEVSHRTGLRLYEMFALRDLKKHILDAGGRGDEGAKRLKGVLAEMKGPPAELTKLLGGGLDAEALLRS
jgi:hypothetical protein